jgi:PAS domain S-box-containing protein
MTNAISFGVVLSLNDCKDIAWESSGKIVIDDKGTIVVANSQAEGMFKTIMGGLIGKKIESVLPLPVVEDHVRLRDEFIRNPLSKSMNLGREVKGRRSDSTEIRVLVALWPFYASGALYVMASIHELS